MGMEINGTELMRIVIGLSSLMPGGNIRNTGDEFVQCRPTAAASTFSKRERRFSKSVSLNLAEIVTCQFTKVVQKALALALRRQGRFDGLGSSDWGKS